MLATSSSQTAVTITSPRKPARTASAPATMIAASPAFMSYEPRPCIRPFSTAGSNGRSMPPTPTVSMCAFRSSVLPPPEPRAIPTVLKRPGRDLLDLHLEPGVLQPPGDEARDLPLPRGALDQVGVDRVDADEVGEELAQRPERHAAILRLGARGLLGSLLVLELALRELDLEPLDALPVHLDDLEAEPVVLDLVAGLRRPAELAEDEAGDRVVVLLRQLRCRTAR